MKHGHASEEYTTVKDTKKDILPLVFILAYKVLF